MNQNSMLYHTQKGLFCYTRLPFGVSSAPGIFQRVMENVLKGITNVIVYLDDILLSSPTEADHLQLLDQVLDHLDKAGLRARKEKCHFVPSVSYLDHKINGEGLHPLPDKVQAIQEAPSPTNVQELKATWACLLITLDFFLICLLCYPLCTDYYKKM